MHTARKPRRAARSPNQKHTTFDRRLELSCPICGAAVTYLAQSATFPFCSDRCRLLDLGRWMNERYAVPCSQAEPGDEGSEMDW